MGSPNTVPKIVWMFWDSGIDSAPEFVQICVRSWQRLNPNWDVRVVDSNSVWTFLDQKDLPNTFSALTVQAKSDILRLNLLDRYGGVWADATVLCLKPLDSWLGAAFPGDFLASRITRVDRLFSSWFLVSEDHGEFVSQWKKLANQYHSVPMRPAEKVLKRVKEKEIRHYFLNSPKKTSLWLSPLFRRARKTYPYFWVHYLANRIVLSGRTHRAEAWMKRHLRDFPLSFVGAITKQRIGENSQSAKEFFLELEEHHTPFLKFRSRLSPPDFTVREIEQALVRAEKRHR